MEPDKSGSFVHGQSRHMRVASMISLVIAHAKQQSEVQLRDVVAGIYVANFERVLRFWPNAASFEDFVAEHCDWSENRLMTWDRWTYETLHPPRTVSIAFTRLFLQIARKNTMTGKMFTQSDDLKRVYSTAEKISPNTVTAFDRVVPLITPELFLFATVRTEGVELGTKLSAAGLHLDELEAVATQRLKSPESLRF